MLPSYLAGVTKTRGLSNVSETHQANGTNSGERSTVQLT